MESMWRMTAPANQAITPMQGYPQDHADQHEQPQPVRPVFGRGAKKVKAVLHFGACFPDHGTVGGGLNTPSHGSFVFPGRDLAARSPGSQQEVVFEAGIGSMTGGAIRQGLAATGDPVTDLVELHLRPDGGILDASGHQELFHHLAL